jgi:hypothetical protein
MADGIEGGVLLSAWSDGDVMRAVGGDLGGGPGVLVNYEDGALCLEREVTDRALWWIHGASEGEWYAVGEGGVVLHSTNGERVREDLGVDITLFGVWDTGDVVYAVGGNIGAGENEGQIWQRVDGEWSVLAEDLPGVLFKVWNNWFVGQDYTYTLEDGALVEVETGVRLLTVRGRDAEDVYAVGGLTGPVAYHWEEGAWVEMETEGMGQALNGVWTDTGEDVWVAGNYGTTAYFDGSQWVSPDEPLTTEHLHAVWKHADETYFFGGNLFTGGDNYGVILRWGTHAETLDVADCPGQ